MHDIQVLAILSAYHRDLKQLNGSQKKALLPYEADTALKALEKRTRCALGLNESESVQQISDNEHNKLNPPSPPSRPDPHST